MLSSPELLTFFFVFTIFAAMLHTIQKGLCAPLKLAQQEKKITLVLSQVAVNSLPSLAVVMNKMDGCFERAITQ